MTSIHAFLELMTIALYVAAPVGAGMLAIWGLRTYSARKEAQQLALRKARRTKR